VRERFCQPHRRRHADGETGRVGADRGHCRRRTLVRYSRSLPIVCSVPPSEVGATNQRTSTFYPGNSGPITAILAAAPNDTILVSPGVYASFALTFPRTVTVKSSVPGTRFTFDVGGNLQLRCIELADGVGLTLEDA